MCCCMKVYSKRRRLGRGVINNPTIYSFKKKDRELLGPCIVQQDCRFSFSFFFFLLWRKNRYVWRHLVDGCGNKIYISKNRYERRLPFCLITHFVCVSIEKSARISGHQTLMKEVSNDYGVG